MAIGLIAPRSARIKEESLTGLKKEHLAAMQAAANEESESENEEHVQMFADSLPELLRADGYIVRNTFIDTESPRNVDQDRAASRRAHSAPAVQLKRRTCKTTHKLSEQGSIEADAETTASSSASPRHASFNLDHESAASSTDDEDNHELKVYKDLAETVSALVNDKCAFLRLDGHQLILKYGAKGSEKNCEKSDEDEEMCLKAHLRFYVHGLPWSKRNKWLVPLLWSVAIVLERSGYNVQMRGGKLSISINESPHLRLDFSSHRLDACTQ